MAHAFDRLKSCLDDVKKWLSANKLKLNPGNSVQDARTPHPGEIVFNTMRYRSNETVQLLGYF